MIVGVMVVSDTGDGIVVGDSGGGGGDQELCLSIRMCIHVLGPKIPS